MYKQTLRLALAISLSSGLSLHAQSIAYPTDGQTVSVSIKEDAARRLFSKAAASNVSAARFAQNAQFLQLDKNGLKQLFRDKLPAISLAIPYHGLELTVDLERVELGTDAVTLLPEDASAAPFPYEHGLHYRGTLRGAPASLAAISFFENEVLGLISTTEFNNLVLGKIQTPDNSLGYVLYPDGDLAMDNPFECILVAPEGHRPLVPGHNSVRSNSGNSLRIALEADYSLVQNRGNATAAVNYLTALFNQAAAVFSREQIELSLSRIAVQQAPRFDRTASSVSVLQQYTSRLDHNAADLFQLVGLADTHPESASYLDGLCAPEYAGAYCAIEPVFSYVPTFSWAASVLIHQLGHQLGAQHTQWCGWPGGAIESCSSGLEGICPRQQEARTDAPTLMRFCLLDGTPAPLAAGFGQLPGDLIRERVAASPCRQQAAAPHPAAEDRFEAPVAAGVDIQVMPNPAQDFAQVGLSAVAPERQVTRIVLLDMLGRPVLLQAVQGETNTVQLKLAGLETGVYLLQVFENDTLLGVKRLIKE